MHVETRTETTVTDTPTTIPATITLSSEELEQAIYDYAGKMGIEIVGGTIRFVNDYDDETSVVSFQSIVRLTFGK